MNARAEHPILSLADFNQPGNLIYGIGNVGRQDDGLGWAFVDWLEQQSDSPQAELQRHYQLHLEDADLISTFGRVLFIDASKDAALESFSLTRVQPKMDFSFSSHAISIPAILATCQQCFEHAPEVYVLAIRGYAWELEQGLSARAQFNLEAAIEWISMRRIESCTV
ncbi:hydrogenase maturation protease [Hydrogenophaga sp.]|uniref:hydrogenase maturation protease n=1 Tax=Hydrogenophaga sp. TaxID=1904254 RepID=UPI0019CA57ED|nr:hydrogenase maturation protease [Hydrogenophaga sp.]MBD3893916.1 hydrogenase maturation protease [Hydrogenophaga sp.]